MTLMHIKRPGKNRERIILPITRVFVDITFSYYYHNALLIMVFLVVPAAILRLVRPDTLGIKITNTVTLEEQLCL